MSVLTSCGDAACARLHSRVREALQQIPAPQRMVIELAFWGGMTQQEIALHCHSPLGTVKTRFRLGMQRLKLLLQESESGDEVRQEIIQDE
jgi:RNA polymerase sigma-70 factor (ECF subfamily)